jgi:hypothetical protein
VSNAAAVISVVLMQTLAGLGVLAAIGLVRTFRDLARNLALAPLAGMAWTGVVAATLATFGSRLSAVGLAALTLATCAAGAVAVRRRSSTPYALGRTRAAQSWLERAVVVGALLALAAVVVAAAALFRVKPLAEYDGWAMWGMKSRAIAALGAADPGVFASAAYSRLHLEYPLLLPSLHALPLQLEDGFSSNTVVLSCFAIGLAGLAAVWGLLRNRVRASILLPFVAALATAPAFFGQLATGYADVPVATFVAAGVVASGRWLLDEERAWLALMTLFVAAATLTKDEGLLFGVATYVALFIAAEGRRRAVGLSALLVALVYAPWRAYVAINDLGGAPYDLSSSFNFPWIVGRLDRIPTAADGLLSRALDAQQFTVILLLGVAAIVSVLVFGPRRLGVLAGGFSAFSFAGLTWIYVLAREEVDVFMSTNGDRVIVSIIVGLVAIAPLLFEEAARQLADYDSARR